MIGGMTSLLGTSVNMVAASLLETYDPSQRVSTFEFFSVGALVCVFGLVYMSVAAWYLLPREVRKSDDDSIVEQDQHRQYVATFVVKPKSEYIGHSVAKSGLTTAKDVDFVSIISEGKAVPYSTEYVLQAGDRYVCGCMDGRRGGG